MSMRTCCGADENKPHKRNCVNFHLPSMAQLMDFFEGRDCIHGIPVDEKCKACAAREARADSGLTHGTDQACAFESGFTAGWDACRASLMSQLQAAEERERVLREALEFASDKIAAAYTANWSEEALRPLVYDVADRARAALALRDKGGGKP